MTGPKRVLDMALPKPSDREIRLLWAAIQDLDQKMTEQIAAPIVTQSNENSLIHDSIGM